MTCCQQFRRYILLAGILLSFAPLRADDTGSLQKQLEHRLLKHVFIVRNFYVGDHLVFDSQGNLLKGDNSLGYNGCRCIAALKVRGLEIMNSELVLHGPRMVGDSEPRMEYSHLSREHTEVQIDIELDQSLMNETAIAGILNKVFLTGKDNLRDLAPPYAWKAAEPVVTAEEASKTGGNSVDVKEMSRIGHGVTPPKAIHSPDPEYSKEARKAKFQGDVMLSIIINAKGNVTQVKITRCLGYGLEDAAVQAASQ